MNSRCICARQFVNFLSFLRSKIFYLILPRRYYMQKSKKFVLLATYAVAVICLLAGLFLPLFEGKSLLALQLPDVFKSLLNKGLGEGAKYDAIAFPIQFFGMGKK